MLKKKKRKEKKERKKEKAQSNEVMSKKTGTSFQWPKL